MASCCFGVPNATHDEPTPCTRTFAAFGTTVALSSFDDTAVATPALRAAHNACRTFENLFSPVIPTSDVSRINAADGQPTVVSEDTYRLIKRGISYCEASQGRFDITIGSVTRLWDFRTGTVPRACDVEVELAHVDYRAIELAGTPGSRTVRLRDNHAALDLGGIAKGYIADAVVALLKEHGLHSFIVNLGGSISTCGHAPSGDRFTFGIPDPRDTTKFIATVSAENVSLVSSGLYERSFWANGVRYHHILDPATGFPAQTDAECVTVIAPRAIDAEGYSTTLCALGIDEGLACARTLPSIDGALFVDSDARLHRA